MKQKRADAIWWSVGQWRKVRGRSKPQWFPREICTGRFDARKSRLPQESVRRVELYYVE